MVLGPDFAPFCTFYTKSSHVCRNMTVLRKFPFHKIAAEWLHLSKTGISTFAWDRILRFIEQQAKNFAFPSFFCRMCYYLCMYIENRTCNVRCLSFSWLTSLFFATADQVWTVTISGFVWNQKNYFSLFGLYAMCILLLMGPGESPSGVLYPNLKGLGFSAKIFYNTKESVIWKKRKRRRTEY